MTSGPNPALAGKIACPHFGDDERADNCCGSADCYARAKQTKQDE